MSEKTFSSNNLTNQKKINPENLITESETQNISSSPKTFSQKNYLKNFKIIGIVFIILTIFLFIFSLFIKKSEKTEKKTEPTKQANKKNEASESSPSAEIIKFSNNLKKLKNDLEDDNYEEVDVSFPVLDWEIEIK